MATHLGTWVAGNISTVGDAESRFADTINDTAVYRGQAIGNVVNGGAQYVAGGAMETDWNFGSRSGAFSVSGFDGHDFSGPINAPSGGSPTDPAAFAGSLSVTSGENPGSGAVNGAFTTDGSGNAAQGVMGSFNVNDGNNWSAAGTFMGSYQPDATPGS